MPQRGCMESPGLGRPRSAPPCAGVLRARSLRQPQPTESDHLVSSHRRTPPPPPPHIYTHTAVTSPRTRASTATDSIRRPLPPAPTPGSARPRVSRSSTGAPPPSLMPPGDGGAQVHSLGGAALGPRSAQRRSLMYARPMAFNSFSYLATAQKAPRGKGRENRREARVVRQGTARRRPETLSTKAPPLPRDHQARRAPAFHPRPPPSASRRRPTAALDRTVSLPLRPSLSGRRTRV